MSPSVYAKAHVIGIEMKRQGVRPSPFFYKRTHPPRFESGKT